MFRSARIKLTFWYLLIIMIISISFSSVIYRFLAREVDRFAEAQRARMMRQLNSPRAQDTVIIGPQANDVNLPQLDEELIEEVKQRLYFAIAMINGGIFVIAGGLAYFVAGKTLQPIQEMMDEQHRFISDASHELKTPLTSLKTAFEVYLRSKKKTVSEAEELICESIDEVNKLQKLTESMLTLASTNRKIEAKTFNKINLSESIATVIKKMKPMASKKKIKIKFEGKNISVKAHQESLRELLTILLDNAIKYSDSKSTISITEKVDKNTVIISFSDQGMGIHAKDIPFIFDRFYRADQARTKSSSDSYGLGLSIAKKIIEDHHGSIQVESIPEKGTTFIIKLPIVA